MTAFDACPRAIEAVERIRSRLPDADPLGRLPDVHPTSIPRHIAIIMDGNGRWAVQRGLPRHAGHRQGMNAVREAVEGAREQIAAGVKPGPQVNWSRRFDMVFYLAMGGLLVYYAKVDHTLPEREKPAWMRRGGNGKNGGGD